MDLKKLLEQGKSAIEKFKKAGLSFDSLKELIKELVQIVESLTSEYFKGKEKKEAVLSLLDDAYVASGIDVKWVPQALERAILRWIAGMIIDTVVAEFNKRGWNK